MPKNKTLRLSKPLANTMCPIGFHVVRGHERICHSGTRTWVDSHIRKNRGSNPKILLIENVLHLYWNSNKKYGRIGAVYGFPENADLDGVIQFWIDYWKQQGLVFPKDLDPLMIKVLIAIESSFDPKAKTLDKTSSARGLMQITNETRRVLSGRTNKGYREMKSDYLELSKSDIEDPIGAVAAGTRWIAHKYSAIPKRAEKNLHNTIKNYHSWDHQGDAYAKNVEALYKKSKKGF